MQSRLGSCSGVGAAKKLDFLKIDRGEILEYAPHVQRPPKGRKHNSKKHNNSNQAELQKREAKSDGNSKLISG